MPRLPQLYLLLPVSLIFGASACGSNDPRAARLSLSEETGVSGQMLLVAAYASEDRLVANQIHPQTGALAPVAALNIAAPSGPSALATLPGRHVFYAALTGAAAVGRYDIEPAADGSSNPLLKEIQRVPTGAQPRALALAPNQSALFVANELASTLSAFSIDASGALASAGKEVATCAEPAAIAVAPDSRSLYVGCSDGEVERFEIVDDGSLAKKDVVTFGGTLSDLRIDHTGRRLFAANPAQGQVEVVALDPSSGALGTARAYAAGAGPTRLQLSPDESRLLVSNQAAPMGVSVYAVGADGALAALGADAAASGSEPSMIVFHPSRPDLFYTIDGLMGWIRLYEINLSSGLPQESASFAAGTEIDALLTLRL